MSAICLRPGNRGRAKGDEENKADAEKPCASDKWAKGTGSRKGKHSDYQGYPDGKVQTDIRKGANWLALRWRIGATSEPVQSGAAITAPETGQLELFCNDDKPEKTPAPFMWSSNRPQPSNNRCREAKLLFLFGVRRWIG